MWTVQVQSEVVTVESEGKDPGSPASKTWCFIKVDSLEIVLKSSSYRCSVAGLAIMTVHSIVQCNRYGSIF